MIVSVFNCWAIVGHCAFLFAVHYCRVVCDRFDSNVTEGVGLCLHQA